MEETIVVSGQLEDSLRQEIESYIEGRLSGLKQEIVQLQSGLNESLSRLLDRHGEVQIDGSVAASILEHLRAAHEEGINLAASESSRAKASSDLAILKAGVAEIDEQQTQAEILKTLVNRCASFAPRVAFFVVKGDQVIGWRARGFQGTVGDDAIRQLSFTTSAETVIGEAIRSKATWSGGPHAHSEDHIILNRLGEEPPQRVLAIPLVVRGRSVAVVYADSAALDADAISLEAVETLVRVAAMAVELLAARSAPARRVEEPSAEEYRPAEYEPAREYEETTTPEYAAPTEAYVQEPSATSEAIPEVVTEDSDYVSAPDNFGATDLVDEAEREPVAVIEPEVQQQAGRRRYGMDVELPIEVTSEDEKRLHSDARRFARLLVSEIKLYNEQKVIEGRSNYDLYDRLREYIDRSREMYDKRVKQEVASKYDYFHHELVNTLAEGDAARLGNAYPGATVSA